MPRRAVICAFICAACEIQRLLRASHADIAQPALLVRIPLEDALRRGESFFLHADHKYRIEFQPFGAVDSHERNLAVLEFFIHTGKQRYRRQKVFQIRLFCTVRCEFLRGVHQLGYVFHSRLSFRTAVQHKHCAVACPIVHF